MKVLGLDLSTKPGFAVLDEEALRSFGTMHDLKSKVERSPAWDHLPDYEFLDIASAVAVKVSKLILDVEPDLVVIEQTNLGRSRVRQKELEFIHSAVLQEIRRIGYQYKTLYLDSSQWRSLCGQKMTKEQRLHNKSVTAGQARGKIRGKHLAVAWCNEKFGLTLKMKDEDAADAISIAYGGLQHQKAVLVPKINVDKMFS